MPRSDSACTPACQVANQLMRRSLSVGSTTVQHMELLAEPSREGWLSLAPEQTPDDQREEGAAARDHTSGGQRCTGHLLSISLCVSGSEHPASGGQLPGNTRVDCAAELENPDASRAPRLSRKLSGSWEPHVRKGSQGYKNEEHFFWECLKGAWPGRSCGHQPGPQQSGCLQCCMAQWQAAGHTAQTMGPVRDPQLRTAPRPGCVCGAEHSPRFVQVDT